MAPRHLAAGDGQSCRHGAQYACIFTVMRTWRRIKGCLHLPRGFSRVAVVCALAATGTAAYAADPEPAATEKLTTDIIIPVDDRGIRAAGIATVLIERERGGTDLSLTGTVAIPQQQIRVVAASAGGLIEEMLVAADEPVQAGQPIAKLRSPAIVEAQRQFLAAIADDALATDRLQAKPAPVRRHVPSPSAICVSRRPRRRRRNRGSTSAHKFSR